jgi:hypothetical protein
MGGAPEYPRFEAACAPSFRPPPDWPDLCCRPRGDRGGGANHRAPDSARPGAPHHPLTLRFTDDKLERAYAGHAADALAIYNGSSTVAAVTFITLCLLAVGLAPMPPATRWLGLLTSAAHLLALLPAGVAQHARGIGGDSRRRLRAASRALNLACLLATLFALPSLSLKTGLTTLTYHHALQIRPSFRAQLLSNAATAALYMALAAGPSCREVAASASAAAAARQLHWAFDAMAAVVLAGHGLVFEGWEVAAPHGQCVASVRFLQFLLAVLLPAAVYYALERASRQAFKRRAGYRRGGRAANAPLCLYAAVAGVTGLWLALKWQAGLAARRG